jgi:hypothetical protein
MCHDKFHPIKINGVAWVACLSIMADENNATMFVDKKEYKQ